MSPVSQLTEIRLVGSVLIREVYVNAPKQGLHEGQATFNTVGTTDYLQFTPTMQGA